MLGKSRKSRLTEASVAPLHGERRDVAVWVVLRLLLHLGQHVANHVALQLSGIKVAHRKCGKCALFADPRL